MGVGEQHAFAGQAIHVRRGDLRGRLITLRIAIAEVIGHDKDDVRCLCRRSVDQRQGQDSEERSRKGHASGISAIPDRLNLEKPSDLL